MALVLGRPGPARPVITAGVAPAAGDEIAFGAATMRAAHTAIGRTVHVVADQADGHPKPVRMRMVGTVIVPPTPFLVTKLGREPLSRCGAMCGSIRAPPGSRAGCRSWCVSPP